MTLGKADGKTKSYLQVLLQVPRKYFPETSRFPQNSTLTHEHLWFALHLYDPYKILSGFHFLVSKPNNLSR